MQLSPISLAITRLGGVRFSPSALFSSGEQGAWYDPSDLTTLFQDSAGTTPVTAVEQSVGLVLDKSKGLVLGSELTTDGSFDGTAAWSGNTVLISSGALRFSASINNAGVFQSNAAYSGGAYQITVVVSSISSGAVTATLGIGTPSASNCINITSAGTYTFTQSNFAGDTNLRVYSVGASTTAVVDSVSVKRIPGNHAYQTTSASRPTLRARYNLLTYSEQFENAAWTKGGGATITPNSVIAPDGTTTADTLSLPTGGGASQIYQSTGITNGPVTASMWIRADAPITLSFGFFDSTGDVTSISVTTSWQRVTWTRAAGLTSADRRACWLYNGSAGSVTVYIWGAQLTQTAVFPSNTYQRIAAATDYATGAAFPPYLFFDGVDDSLLTNSVDFSATDKMTVWAGVTSISNSNYGGVVGIGATVNIAGSFLLLLGSAGAGGKIEAYAKGSTSATTGSQISSSALTVPSTFLSTLQYDIAQVSINDQIKLRFNGASQASTGSSTAGTGVFANLPLNIGQYNGSNRLNGNIYSLIIRGAQSTAAQISSTESWVAAKTPLGSL